MRQWLDLAEISNPEGYPTLGAFFRRKLKNTARPIDSEVPLTSPCDGRVLACGLVDPATGFLEQVGSLSHTFSELKFLILAKIGGFDAIFARSGSHKIKAVALIMHTYKK